jgi:uncharacterized protein (DUF58 family)
MLRAIKDIFLNTRLFYAIGFVSLVLLLSYFFTFLLPIGKLLLIALIIVVITDIILLFNVAKGILANRLLADRLSNGDENLIKLIIDNRYNFNTSLTIIDEVPFQFQNRDLKFNIKLAPKGNEIIKYNLRPVKRGEYEFGLINIYVCSPIGLISRRYQLDKKVTVPVYPSYIQMRKFELLAISNQLTAIGIKKIRRIGHNMEFEQIKEYTEGDDFRSINWKATARHGELMVNTYQDEKSQQVYCIIDKSRVMQMPFDGMSLLDYAINTSLALANIIIKKDDKAGLLTFQHKVGAHLKASASNKQMLKILETLYNEKTAYKEADYSRLYIDIKQNINQRSLLLLFTNFETRSAMKRQLPYLQKLARAHLLVVIFFENTEMRSLIHEPASNTKGIYYKAIAENLHFEKKLIAQELSKHGIHSVISAPSELSINSINKYLELKSRGMI